MAQQGSWKKEKKNQAIFNFSSLSKKERTFLFPEAEDLQQLGPEVVAHDFKVSPPKGKKEEEADERESRSAAQGVRTMKRSGRAKKKKRLKFFSSLLSLSPLDFTLLLSTRGKKKTQREKRSVPSSSSLSAKKPPSILPPLPVTLAHVNLEASSGVTRRRARAAVRKFFFEFLRKGRRGRRGMACRHGALFFDSLLSPAALSLVYYTPKPL